MLRKVLLVALSMTLMQSSFANDDLHRDFLLSLVNQIDPDRSGENLIYRINKVDGLKCGPTLASTGASVDGIIQIYNNIDVSGYGKYLYNVSNFDRTFKVKNGRLGFLSEPLSDIWKRKLLNILSESTEEHGIEYNKIKEFKKENLNVFFKNFDKKIYSEKYKKYLFYKDMNNKLLQGKVDLIKRKIPEASNYDDLEDIKLTLTNMWEKEASKNKIDSILKKIDVITYQPYYFRVNDMLNSYNNNLYSFYNVPETKLKPNPLVWQTQAKWVRVVHRNTSLQGEYRFQLATIDVVRNWLRLDTLPVTEFPRKVANDFSNFTKKISGDLFSSSSTGDFVGFVTKLILIRDVHFIPNERKKNIPVVEHPLDIFSNSEAINLLGYSVCYLDSYIPSSENNDLSSIVYNFFKKK